MSLSAQLSSYVKVVIKSTFIVFILFPLISFEKKNYAREWWRCIYKYLMYVLYSIYNISLYKYVGSGGGICNCYTDDPYTLS